MIKQSKKDSKGLSKFTVEVYTKGAREICLIPLPSNEKINTITEKKAYKLRDTADNTYIMDQAFPEECDIDFFISVKDEDGNYVYNKEEESMELCEFYGVEDFYENKKWIALGNELSKPIVSIPEGRYILIETIEKRRYQTFVIRDDKFHLDKFFFLPYSDDAVLGLLDSDSWNSVHNFIYDKKNIKPEISDDGCLFWGDNIYVVEKKQYCWETIRQIR